VKKITVALIGQILLSCWQLSAHAQDTEIDFGKLAVQSDEVATSVAKIRAHIDRSSFDLDSALDKLDYDANTIISFVQQQIVFESYRGTLRGAEGTLASRAGNSLDQSILLAKLLKDAGYEARIVRGRLTDQDATILLNELRNLPETEPPVGDIAAIAAELTRGKASPEEVRDIEDQLSSIPGPQSAPWFSLVKENESQILGQLENADIQLPGKSISGQYIEEVRDYFWVEFKDMAQDPWKDIHVAFGSTMPGQPVQTIETYADNIPVDLQHRFRIRVMLEIKTGNAISVRQLAAPWERPVSNLYAMPLTFANVPNTLMAENSFSITLEEALRSADYFAPVFNGAMAEGAPYFDLTGNLIDPMAAQSSGAGVFENINRAFSGAITEMGDEKTLPTITAQWLEFTFVEPGGRETSYQRMIFDRLGPAARQSGKFPDPSTRTGLEDVRELVQRHTIMVHAGRIPRSLAMDQSLEQLGRWASGHANYLRALATSDTSRNTVATALEDVPTAWSGFPTLFHEFDRVERLFPNHHIYRHGPSLVIFREGLAAENGAISAIDIVTNPRRAYRIDASSLEIDPAPLVTAGAWDTEVESVPIPDGENKISVSAAIEKAIDAGSKLVMLDDHSDLSTAEFSANIKTVMANEITNGYVIIAPEYSVSDSAVAWWRVDPSTGQTLGQLSSGKGGSESIEFLEVLGFGISTAALASSLYSCNFGDNVSTRMGDQICCGLSNVWFYCIGAFVGSLNYASTAAKFGYGLAWDLETYFLVNICD
jgi:hypothetical protein